MCGRFTQHAQLNLLLQQFAIEAGPELAPRFNVAPTQSVPIVRMDPKTGKRELKPLRWGLVPSWAKELSIGNRMINARGETVADKPSFRSAFKKRRCIVPANGYFEWQKTPDGKQPYYIRSPSEHTLAMAGLWERWKDEAGEFVETFTVITTDANDITSTIHDRMPVMLDEADMELWLDPDFSERESLESKLVPCPDDWLVAEKVSTRVNSPRNDDPSCIEPLA